MNNTGNFGQLLRELRLQRRITLREFALKSFSDIGNLSKLERGLAPPPQDLAILLRYATALNIEDGSEFWYQLVDLAAAGRGIVPQDIMDDEQLAQSLPAFFRTIRGQKPTAEELDQFIELIRHS